MDDPVETLPSEGEIKEPVEAQKEPEKEPTPEEIKLRKHIGNESRLLRERRELRDELSDKNAENAYLKGKLETLENLSKKEARPKAEDYETDEAFTDDLADWKMDQKAPEIKPEPIAKPAMPQYVQEELMSSIEEGRSKYPDFDSVVLDDTLPFPPNLTTVIVSQDRSEDILYHFATHETLLRKVSKLSLKEQRSEVIKVLAVLNTPSGSKTPDPIKPVSGQSQGKPALKDMSMRDYVTAKNKEQGIRLG